MSDSPYSLFFSSGLHAPASSVYSYNHPADDDTEPEHEQQSNLPAPYLSALHNTASRSQTQNLIPRSPTRKRRSSLTAATSPVSAIKLAKSPARAAANAWHLTAAQSPSRSRSGSLSVASEDTSMLGRMRSGSVGSRLRPRKPLTSRRPVALLFAPTLPPPTAPLPALPPSEPARPPLSRLTIQPQVVFPHSADADAFYSAPASLGLTPVSPVPSSPGAEFYHAAGVWSGFSTIDEEMKEN